MNVQILDRRYEEPIEGFSIINFDGQQFENMGDYSDNECRFILAPELLSYIPATSYPVVIETLLKKLRMNGEMVVGGTELNAFAEAVKKGQIDQETSAGVVAKSISMGEVNKVCELLNGLGNYQISWVCSGVHYEIKIRRV